MHLSRNSTPAFSCFKVELKLYCNSRHMYLDSVGTTSFPLSSEDLQDNKIRFFQSLLLKGGELARGKFTDAYKACSRSHLHSKGSLLSVYMYICALVPQIRGTKVHNADISIWLELTGWYFVPSSHLGGCQSVKHDINLCRRCLIRDLQ